MTYRAVLDLSAFTTLDAGGNGTVKLGPLSGRETWYPSTVHISTNQASGSVVNEAVCKIYTGDQPIASNYRDTTFTGSSGDSTGKVSNDRIRVGQYVWAVWTGGDAGVTAMMNVTGDKDV